MTAKYGDIEEVTRALNSPETRLEMITDDRHRSVLKWFVDHSGLEVGWPHPLQLPEGPSLVACKAKAIYKPSWSAYAISVRENLLGRYDDRVPVWSEGGGWTYRSFQENPNSSRRDEEFTNRALMLCIRDKVPVGVIRQIKLKPRSRYRVLGLALVTEWQDGYFVLKGDR